LFLKGRCSEASYLKYETHSDVRGEYPVTATQKWIDVYFFFSGEEINNSKGVIIEQHTKIIYFKISARRSFRR
jgi:hypothetical protein